eukprot:95282-Hanusia_phi.AAC.1
MSTGFCPHLPPQSRRPFFRSSSPSTSSRLLAFVSHLLPPPLSACENELVRVGRTARAGRSGQSVTMVTQYDVELFQRIGKDKTEREEEQEQEESDVLWQRS